MSSRFDFIETPIDDLLLLQRRPIGDSRGYLERMFCLQEMANCLGGATIAQVNHTQTAQCGTLRGMHFQFAPHAEMKLVSCIKGEVFDVAIDLRHSSPTFLRWHGEILSAANQRTLIIPKGFAHGFQTLVDDCEMLYFHTAAYHAGSEGGVNATDPRLSISWPLPISDRSARDMQHPLINDQFTGAL
jgi:dTDP-4-dehydrorhamnose 3,5-epimerase